MVDNLQIAELNRQYFDRRGPTNVIAFPMRSDSFSDIAPHLLGDVVVSVERTFEEALAAGLDPQVRLAHLLIHGILHLFGYDHEQGGDEAARMEAEEARLLAQLEAEGL